MSRRPAPTTRPQPHPVLCSPRRSSTPPAFAPPLRATTSYPPRSSENRLDTRASPRGRRRRAGALLLARPQQKPPPPPPPGAQAAAPRPQSRASVERSCAACGERCEHSHAVKKRSTPPPAQYRTGRKEKTAHGKRCPGGESAHRPGGESAHRLPSTLQPHRPTPNVRTHSARRPVSPLSLPPSSSLLRHASRTVRAHTDLQDELARGVVVPRARFIQAWSKGIQGVHDINTAVLR
jgi:hypothetical protein